MSNSRRDLLVGTRTRNTPPPSRGSWWIGGESDLVSRNETKNAKTVLFYKKRQDFPTSNCKMRDYCLLLYYRCLQWGSRYRLECLDPFTDYFVLHPSSSSTMEMRNGSTPQWKMKRTRYHDSSQKTLWGNNVFKDQGFRGLFWLPFPRYGTTEGMVVSVLESPFVYHPCDYV